MCKWLIFHVWLHAPTGLVTAGLIADLFRAAQPALLYLVPGVLIPLFVKAILQVSAWLVIKVRWHLHKLTSSHYYESVHSMVLQRWPLLRDCLVHKLFT